jgi:predicted enzyme related to lactoylglutathione lyase
MLALKEQKNKMTNTNLVRGLATISFYAQDLDKAKKWYSELFGIEPYFNVPGYIEFRLGDYEHELGIIDSQYAPEGATKGTGGAIAYWCVDDLQGSLDKFIAAGATLYDPITDRSGGKGTFVTASVVDPFGNVFGLMTNVHYMEILKQKSIQK